MMFHLNMHLALKWQTMRGTYGPIHSQGPQQLSETRIRTNVTGVSQTPNSPYTA